MTRQFTVEQAREMVTVDAIVTGLQCKLWLFGLKGNTPL